VNFMSLQEFFEEFSKTFTDELNKRLKNIEKKYSPPSSKEVARTTAISLSESLEQILPPTP